MGFERTLIPMRAAKASDTLAHRYRYTLYDADGNEKGVEVMSEAEFIALILQEGGRPEARTERPCAKCTALRCIDEDLCEKGKTVCYMALGKLITQITKTGYDFAGYLIDNGLTTGEAVQAQIRKENAEKEKAAKEAERIESEQKATLEAKQLAKKEFEKWLDETARNYGGLNALENEKISIQKEIFIDMTGSYHERVISLLVMIDNIENPLCRRDVISRLHNGNNASIKTFECVTGVKLAKTNKERRAQLEKISKEEYGRPKRYKPRKPAQATEYSDVFYIMRRKEGGGAEFVESKGKLWRYGGYDFFLRKEDDGCYNVTEGRSGLSMGNSYPTFSAAKTAVKDKLTKFADDFEKQINDFVQKRGVSPLYAETDTE